MKKKIWVLLIILALILTTGCRIQKYRVIREQLSPTGEYIAIYYDNSGGTTSGWFEYALSINKAHQFIISNYNQKNVLITDTYINFEWTDDYELTITATNGRRDLFCQKDAPKIIM